MPDYIFHDPTGKRARRTGLAGGLLVALAALMVAGFFATLAFAPRLPAAELQDPRVLTPLREAWREVVAAQGSTPPAAVSSV